MGRPPDSAAMVRDRGWIGDDPVPVRVSSMPGSPSSRRSRLRVTGSDPQAPHVLPTEPVGPRRDQPANTSGKGSMSPAMGTMPPARRCCNTSESGPSGPGGGQRPSVQADACAGPSARSEPGAQARRISPSSALPGRSSRPLTAGVPAGPGCLQQLRLALLDLRAKCLQVKTLHVARPPWCAGSTVEANEVRLGPHSPRTVQARAPFPARDSTVNGGQVGPPIGWLRQRGQAEDRGQRRIRGSEKVGLALRSGRSGAGRRAK
jgi:hypothetical protein